MPDSVPPAGSVFARRAPHVQSAWQATITSLRDHSVLEPRIRELIFIGVMAAARLPEGVYSHARTALQVGANEAEVTEACLQALAATGAATFLYALPEVDRAIRDHTQPSG